MRSAPKAGHLLLLAVLAAFLAGVAHLFILRFEAGDTYPAYSSLRTDPLGSKALYDSFASLEGMTVLRNYQQRVPDGRRGNTTLLLAGLRSGAIESMSRKDADEIATFVLDGGRLVLLLYPQGPEFMPSEPAERSGAAGEGGKTDARDLPPRGPERDRKERYAEDSVSLLERWNIGLQREKLPAGTVAGRMVAVPAGGAPAAQKVSWHSSLWFDEPGSEWTVVLERESRPVLVERRYGRGSVLLSADSYFVSNEALVKERHPWLLARLAGPNSVVIFDETHLGIQDAPGVVSLARKYRLEGMFGGVLFLAILFIWKNSSGLVPPGDGRGEPDGPAPGEKDHFSGLAGLLRRMIPRDQILAICAEEWKRTNRKGAGGEAALVGSIVDAEAKRPARERDPVGAYRAIHTLLSERKRAI